MGMFDMVEVCCPSCGVVNSIQTKILGLNSCLRSFRIDDIVKFDDGVLQLKEVCQECGKPLCVEIRNSKIVAVSNSNTPDYAEGAWGQVYESRHEDERDRSGNSRAERDGGAGR